MSIEDRIKRLMEVNKMSNEELAKKIGVTKGCIAAWFLQTHNKRNIGTKLVDKIADVFEVSPAYLKYGVGSGAENYYLHLVNGNVKFTVADNVAKITKLASKYKINHDNIKTCYCYTDEMSQYIAESDILHVDFTENQVVSNGCYILVTTDGIAVRFVKKDLFTKEYIISTPTESRHIKEDDWEDLILHAYRILMIEHEL